MSAAATIAVAALSAAMASPTTLGEATLGARLNAGLWSYVAGAQVRIVRHEDAHRRAALAGGVDAWFETGDRDAASYVRRHRPLRDGYTFYAGRAEYDGARERFMATAGINAEADMAMDESLPWAARVPAQLTAVLYGVKGAYNDFLAAGVDQRAHAQRQIGAAMLTWSGLATSAVYLGARGSSVRVGRAMGATRLEVEASRSECEAMLSRTYRFDGGISITPRFTTNLRSLSGGIALRWRRMTIEAASYNPRTLSGARGSNGAERTTYEASARLNFSK